MDSEAAVLTSEGTGAALAADEILERVRHVVAIALVVDEADVTPTSSIIEDLGGESLDFLDIIFRLQKEFGVEFPKDNMLERESLRRKAALGRPPDAPCDLVEDGLLTDAGLALMREKMPEVDPARIVAGLREDDIVALINVQTFANAVEKLLRGEEL
jgi:acyl carrier protein